MCYILIGDKKKLSSLLICTKIKNKGCIDMIWETYVCMSPMSMAGIC